MLVCKLLIWTDPIAHFGRPHFKFWLKACLCINQQILHILYEWYQSAKFYNEVISLFIIIPISATFEIKLLTASTIWLVLTRTYALLQRKVTDDVQAYFVRICPLISTLAATLATNISVGASENWNLLAH